MLIMLFEWLHTFGIKMPSAFTYFSTRMILASITALLLTIFLGPKFIKKLYELKIGQPVRSVEEVPLLAELHEKKKDTPTMGGVLILFSMTISLFLWMDLTSVFTWILFFTTLFLGLLGGLDDFFKLKRKNSRGLSPRLKFIAQLLFSSSLACFLLFPSISAFFVDQPPMAKEQISEKKGKGIPLEKYVKRLYFPFFKDPLFSFPTILGFVFIVFVITGSSNAVNLTDGLDGLAAGCLIMVSATLALFAFFSNHVDLARYLNILYIEGSGEIAVYLLALAGACLGFLWYNGYPAQVFMGDTGSLALGGVLGVGAVLLKREMILALAGGIFVVEALSVILQVLSYRYRNKKRVFLCAPLHHHFEYKGWCETKVVLRFWIIALLLAIIAVASLKLQ